MILKSNLSTIRIGSRTPFNASGGTEPYSYEVLPLGAGGVINSASGIYTAPAFLSDDAALSFDIIRVTDALLVTVDLQINVQTVEMMLANIIQKALALADDQVIIYNQKFTIPNDKRMYISILVADSKPYANNSSVDGTGAGLDSLQTVFMREIISINIMSATIESLQRKEEVLMALSSIYSVQQQESNGFSIAKTPISFNNLSQIEGSQIPYMYQFAIAIQYSKSTVKDISYFDTFEQPIIITNT